MLNFFMMIFQGFIFIANISSRLFTWFSSMARFAIFSKAIRYFLFTLFSAFLLMLVLFTGFFFYYVISHIIQIYNLISYALALISSSSTSGDSTISTMFFFLSIFGISSALQAVLPIISSALLFVLVKSLYRITLFFYRQVKEVADTIIQVI